MFWQARGTALEPSSTLKPKLPKLCVCGQARRNRACQHNIYIYIYIYIFFFSGKNEGFIQSVVTAIIQAKRHHIMSTRQDWFINDRRVHDSTGLFKNIQRKANMAKTNIQNFPTCLPGCHMNPTDGKTVKKALPTARPSRQGSWRGNQSMMICHLVL